MTVECKECMENTVEMTPFSVLDTLGVIMIRGLVSGGSLLPPAIGSSSTLQYSIWKVVNRVTVTKWKFMMDKTNTTIFCQKVVETVFLTQCILLVLISS